MRLARRLSRGFAGSYGASFLDELEAGSTRSARRIVPLVARLVRPRSVVDVGCGTGGWLGAFRDAGVTDIFGIDGPWVEPRKLAIAAEHFSSRDLRAPFQLERQFDLAISLEVAEHLPAASADGFVASVAALAPVILFSAAIPGQRGAHHVNEQWPDYWLRRFEAKGFTAIDCIRPAFWDDPDVEFWYAQNAFLLVRAQRLPELPELAGLDRAPRQMLRAVHPRLWADRAGLGTARPPGLLPRGLLRHVAALARRRPGKEI